MHGSGGLVAAANGRVQRDLQTKDGAQKKKVGCCGSAGSLVAHRSDIMVVCLRWLIWLFRASITPLRAVGPMRV